MKSDNEPNANDVSDLDEIVLNIFGFLSVSQLVNVALVCRKWHRIANDSSLWRDLVLQRWPSQKPILHRVSALALDWQQLYRNLSTKGSYSPDDMKYFIVCKVGEITPDSEELRRAVLLRMEEVTSSWEKPGLYELEETSPRFFNNNMELYYDTHDLKWVFVDRRREYVDDSFTIRLNLDRMSSRRMRFIRPYQVMASCVMMYRWLYLFRQMFTEDVGLTFYRIWRFRLKHIKTGFIFETYDWKAAMSSTFSHGCPLAESFKDGGLAILDMLSSPFFVLHPMGSNTYKIWYEISLLQGSDSNRSSRNISRSSSVETLDSCKSESEIRPQVISQSSSLDTLDSCKSGSDETESEENGDDTGYFCNCEYFIHRSSWEYDEQQMVQAEIASQWEIIHLKPNTSFAVVFDSCDEKWLFYKPNTDNYLQYPVVLNRKLVDRSLDSTLDVRSNLSDDAQVVAPIVDRITELPSSIIGQEALPSSLTLYRLVCLFDLSSVEYRNLHEDCSIWSISLQHRSTQGILQLKDLNGWLRVFVSVNEELKLFCNDLGMMSLNQSFGFLDDTCHVPDPAMSPVAGSSKHKSSDLPASTSETEDLMVDRSADDYGNPLEKLKNDVCSLMELLVNQRFAHPYGTVAGSVA